MKRKIIINILYIIEIILLSLLFLKFFPSVIMIVGIIFMIVLIVLTTKINNSISDWERHIKNWDNPELTFEEFYSLYSVMPEKFQLNRFDVTYRYKDISFKTYIDYYKYMKFFERYKEQKKEIKRTEIQTNLIKELQRDLAAKQKENDQWVKENLKKDVHIEQTSI